MSWSYQREEAQFQPLPEGKYRVRVKSAEKAVSKNSGKDMLVLQLEISGSNKVLYHYIVFNEDNPEMTNRMLTQFFDSFKDIAEGDFNISNWIGKVGAVKIKHDSSYDGTPREKVSYFVAVDKQDDLPPWQNSDGTVVTTNGFLQLPESASNGLPF